MVLNVLVVNDYFAQADVVYIDTGEGGRFSSFIAWIDPPWRLPHGFIDQDTFKHKGLLR